MSISLISRHKVTILRVVLAVFIILILQACAEGGRTTGGGIDKFDQTLFDAADADRGGRLYDNWWNAQNTPSTPPTAEQPLWAQRADTNIEQDNSSSWRCKTCHGWDYAGNEGAYSQGRNPEKYTGFPGLLQLKFDDNGEPDTPEHVFGFIANGIAGNYEDADHKFGQYLTNEDLHDLTAFIVNEAWNGIGAPFSGNSTSGESIFLSVDKGCTGQGCHDTPDGQAMITAVAEENPEEFIHKVRFGNPFPAMPGGRTTADAKNVLAFLLTGAGTGDIGNFSQVKFAAANLSKGGLIFDKWWEVAANSNVPDSDHPKWPADVNPNITGSSTWRCKQCHGWDYQGKDGAYADGKNYTGIKGIVPTPNTPVKYSSAGEVYQFLLTDPIHAFGAAGYLNESEIYDATRFVMTMREEAQANRASFQFIDPLTKLVRIDRNIDKSNGETLYHGDAQCSACHGADGKQIDFANGIVGDGDDEFLSDIAIGNPWEFVHKSRFGDISSSGQTMPAMVESTSAALTTTEAAVDILAFAQDSLVPKFDVAGRLYDNWAVEAKVANAPQDTNPIWTATGNTSKSGATTWRCKSCHGWDYLGANGAYGSTSSSYYTGIRGLSGLSATNPTLLTDFIKNGSSSYPTHNFGQYLSDEQIGLLVNFIQSDQGIKTFESEQAAADMSNGQIIYKGDTPGGCETCHGADGTLQAAPIGDVARDNVPEFLHKVRFGHPGSSMIPAPGNFMGLTPQQAYDVVKYVETLGATGSGNYATASLVRGGRLYDKWWEELKAGDAGAQAPAAVNPLWEMRNSAIPDLAADKKTTYSWRCKTCHSWDYLGIGFYSGPRKSVGTTQDTLNPFGADNLLYKIGLIKESTLQEEQKQQQLFDWLKSGISTEIHDFSTPRTAIPTALSDADIWDLVKFLMEGLINTDTYIYRFFETVKGPYRNTANGQGLYHGTIDPAINCASCHGEDGRGIVGTATEGVDIFALANSNPWEFLHKTRFGQPNAPMPAFLDPSSDHSTIHGLHVLDYAQQQFNSRPGVALE